MARKLTDSKVKTATCKADGKPLNLSDGGGLYLHVKAGSKKVWRYNYRMDGKQKTLAVGVYPAISLQGARERHRQARELLARGIDPSTRKQEQKAIKADLVHNSFEVIAREYHRRYLPTWQPTYAAKMMGYLEKDVFPWIGSRPIADIEAPEIVKVI